LLALSAVGRQKIKAANKNAADAENRSREYGMHRLPAVDLLVIIAYLTTVVGVGLWFARRRGDADDYMAAHRSLPGWAVGLSMFGSYVSSISFLANPGKAYASNWNPFVFSLATPLAAAIAVRWFVPFYRHTGEVSAYEHLERRFGPWARTYAVVCFLLVQMARTGTVIYLLALAVSPLTGWSVETTILLTGVLMTFYTLAGGIKAVVWTGVLQSLVLVAGPVICVIALSVKTPGGLAEIVRVGAAEQKFSLGGFGDWTTYDGIIAALSQPTFWVVFVYGLTINVGNFGIDQSYVQRYITARNDREAAKSVWMTALLYTPVAAVFFFIGTALFVFYRARPELLGSATAADQVFPHFIATQLPVGLAGLVVAAIFAASMDSNLNSMATLTLCDIYQRYLRPKADGREALHVLYLATAFWGVLGTGVAVAMIRAQSALDVWWQLAGMFSGGTLGLFLLGFLSRRAGNMGAAIGVALGVLVIVWMSLSATNYWKDTWTQYRSPLHGFLAIVAGTVIILVVGAMFGRKGRHETPGGKTASNDEPAEAGAAMSERPSA
jgi:SSS family solute:Na+ symporter